MNAEVTDKEALEKITGYLFDEKRIKFLYDPPTAMRSGLSPEASGDETGKLIRSFSLEKLIQEVFGVGGLSEERTLELLDVLASQRKIHVFSLKIPPDDYRSLRISCLVGVGLWGHRGSTTQAGSHLLKVIWFRDKVHDLPGGVSKPSTRAAFLRQERDANFARRFPQINLELQSAIRSEERQAKQAFENAVLEMVERIDKKLDKLKT